VKRFDIIREVAVGKVVAHLCLTLIVKELKIRVEQGRVVTTLNIIVSVVDSSSSPLELLVPPRWGPRVLRILEP